MGICWCSPADNPTPSTTGHLSSVISQSTSNTASTATSRGSNISRDSRFSASSGDEAFQNGQILPTPNLRDFSFAEMKVATKNFRPDMVLGEGGFGKVFKGWLDEKGTGKNGIGTPIAVKKLNSEGWQGFEEWQSVVNFLGRLSHPHLVRLLGYCWEDKELLLIYEFMQKGSLENHLFGNILEQIESINENPKEPRKRAAHQTARRHQRQPLHHQSPLAPKHEAKRSNSNPPQLR